MTIVYFDKCHRMATLLLYSSYIVKVTNVKLKCEYLKNSEN